MDPADLVRHLPPGGVGHQDPIQLGGAEVIDPAAPAGAQHQGAVLLQGIIRVLRVLLGQGVIGRKVPVLELVSQGADAVGPVLCQPVFAAFEVVQVGVVLRVPGSVQAVVEFAQLHNVPGVVHGLAGDHPCVYAGFQAQPVKGRGIALADGGAMDQGGVGRVFQGIGLVVEIRPVVGHVPAEIAVDGVDLLPVVLPLQVQFSQEPVHGPVQLRLLVLRGVVEEVEGELAGEFLIGYLLKAVGAPIAAELVAQIVPLCGDPCVGHGPGVDGPHKIRRHRHTRQPEFRPEAGLPVLEALTHGLGGLFYGGVVAVFQGGVGRHHGNGRNVRLGEHILVERVDEDDFLRRGQLLRLLRLCRRRFLRRLLRGFLRRLWGFRSLFRGCFGFRGCLRGCLGFCRCLSSLFRLCGRRLQGFQGLRGCLRPFLRPGRHQGQAQAHSQHQRNYPFHPASPPPKV